MSATATVSKADDTKLGLIRIHDSLGPAIDYAQLVLLATDFIPREHRDAIARGVEACRDAILQTQRLIDELRETSRVGDEEKKAD